MAVLQSRHDGLPIELARVDVKNAGFFVVDPDGCVLGHDRILYG
jgi:hypothetical protein